MQIRRSGPQVKVQDQGQAPRFIRRHKLQNCTDEWLSLQQCKILGEGRWFEPPLAKIGNLTYALFCCFYAVFVVNNPELIVFLLFFCCFSAVFMVNKLIAPGEYAEWSTISTPGAV